MLGAILNVVAAGHSHDLGLYDDPAQAFGAFGDNSRDSGCKQRGSEDCIGRTLALANRRLRGGQAMTG